MNEYKGSYHISQDVNGCMRAVHYKQIYVEKRDNEEMYSLYGIDESGSVYHLFSDPSLKECNRKLLMRCGIDPITIALIEVNDG